MQKKAYQCDDCKKEQIIEDGETAPQCCGIPMQEIPLETCTKHYDPEGARFQDNDDACDDGVH